MSTDGRMAVTFCKALFRGLCENRSRQAIIGAKEIKTYSRS